MIPDTAKEKPQEGTVVAVGPGRFEQGNRVPLDVAVGDKVIRAEIISLGAQSIARPTTPAGTRIGP